MFRAFFESIGLVAPAWAQGTRLSAGSAKSLVAAVRTYCEDNGATVVIGDDGIAAITGPHGSGSVDLRSFATLWSVAPGPSQIWSGLRHIAPDLKILAASEARTRKELADRADALAALRDPAVGLADVRLSVAREGYGRLPKLLHAEVRTIAPELSVIVTLATTRHTPGVPVDLVEAWGLTPDALHARACANLLALPITTTRQGILHIEAGPYAGMRWAVAPPLPGGRLIAAPHDDVLVCAPVEDPDASVAELWDYIQRNLEGGPVGGLHKFLVWQDPEGALHRFSVLEHTILGPNTPRFEWRAPPGLRR